MNATLPAVPRSAVDEDATRAFYRGKRVAVTGALGFLGTSVVRELAGIDCEIVRVARRAALGVEGAARIVELPGDVRDRAVWARAIDGADVIFHLAARTDALDANADRDSDFESNVRPALHFVEACAGLARAPVLVFAGTVTQPASAGDASPAGRGHGVYDEHKLAAEMILERAASEGSVVATTLRLSNLYGPGPLGSASRRGVLNAMIRKALAGEPLTVFGSGDFMRDYLHVRDAARAFLAAGRSIARLNARHFVVGSGVGHTIEQAFHLVAERVAIATGRAPRVIHVDPPMPLTALDTRSFVADASHFRAVTGWAPSRELAAGIDETIEEMRCGSW